MSNRELTQAEEDYLANRVQETLEERAMNEAETNADQFADWAIAYQPTELTDIASRLIKGTSQAVYDAERWSWQMRDDYVQYRIANADVAELARIREKLMEEFA